MQEPPSLDTNGRTYERQLSVLDFISALLTESGFDLQPLLDELVRVTAETMQMKACTIRLLDAETGEMKLKATHGLSREYLEKGPVFAGRSIFRQLIERCCTEDDIVEIDDVAADPRVQYTREAVTEGIRSLIAAPLVRDGRAIGGLTVFTAERHHFSDDERRLFKTIANQASIAISLAQLYQEKLALITWHQEQAQREAKRFPLLYLDEASYKGGSDASSMAGNRCEQVTSCVKS